MNSILFGVPLNIEETLQFLNNNYQDKFENINFNNIKNLEDFLSITFIDKVIYTSSEKSYNFYLKYVQILQFRLETLFFYYLEFEEFRY
jgi:hypothetical protein